MYPSSLARFILAAVLFSTLLLAPIGSPRTTSARRGASVPPMSAAIVKDEDKDDGKKIKPCKEKKDKKDKDDERCLRGSSSGIARADFNGDGFGDLAVGVPSQYRLR